eukprot:Lankesteria_metandrocarpae@DN5443_c1_g3_i2.p1
MTTQRPAGRSSRLRHMGTYSNTTPKWVLIGKFLNTLSLFTIILLGTVILLDRVIVFWTTNTAVLQLATYKDNSSSSHTGILTPSFLARESRGGFGDRCRLKEGWCAFRTDIPMYYINLDRNRARRAYMEEAFSCAGNLTRVPATDGKKGQLDKYVNTGGLSKNNNWRQFTDAVSATVAEVALTSSHLRAIQTAYANNDQAAIIFEDDAGVQLVPLWEDTPDELLLVANEKFVNTWEVMFLHFSFSDRRFYDRYVHNSRAKPSEVVTGDKMGLTYGFVAYMVSRKGMQRVIKTWSDAKDGKLNCLNYKKEKCVANKAFHRGMDTAPNARLYPTPPLFISKLFEDSTGVRDIKLHKINIIIKYILALILTQFYDRQNGTNCVR